MSVNTDGRTDGQTSVLNCSEAHRLWGAGKVGSSGTCWLVVTRDLMSGLLGTPDSDKSTTDQL